MLLSFPNLDSIAISVVLSTAYRQSAGQRRAPITCNDRPGFTRSEPAETPGWRRRTRSGGPPPAGRRQHSNDTGGRAGT
jgi:hypothetical protein